MKLTFYVDIFSTQHQRQYGFMATTAPAKKMENTKRWTFDVTIPDDVIHDVDGHAPEVTRPRLVEDGE